MTENKVYYYSNKDCRKTELEPSVSWTGRSLAPSLNLQVWQLLNKIECQSGKCTKIGVSVCKFWTGFRGSTWILELMFSGWIVEPPLVGGSVIDYNDVIWHLISYKRISWYHDPLTYSHAVMLSQSCCTDVRCASATRRKHRQLTTMRGGAAATWSKLHLAAAGYCWTSECRKSKLFITLVLR